MFRQCLHVSFRYNFISVSYWVSIFNYTWYQLKFHSGTSSFRYEYGISLTDQLAYVFDPLMLGVTKTRNAKQRNNETGIFFILFFLWNNETGIFRFSCSVVQRPTRVPPLANSYPDSFYFPNRKWDWVWGWQDQWTADWLVKFSGLRTYVLFINLW